MGFREALCISLSLRAPVCISVCVPCWLRGLTPDVGGGTSFKLYGRCPLTSTLHPSRGPLRPATSPCLLHGLPAGLSKVDTVLWPRRGPHPALRPAGWEVGGGGQFSLPSD